MEFTNRIIFFLTFLLFICSAYAEETRKVKLSWPSVEGAYAYEIKLSSDKRENNGQTSIEKTSVPAWTRNLLPGNYSFQIRSIDQRGAAGKWSVKNPFTVSKSNKKSSNSLNSFGSSPYLMRVGFQNSSFTLQNTVNKSETIGNNDIVINDEINGNAFSFYIERKLNFKTSISTEITLQNIATEDKAWNLMNFEANYHYTLSKSQTSYVLLLGLFYKNSPHEFSDGTINSNGEDVIEYDNLGFFGVNTGIDIKYTFNSHFELGSLFKINLNAFTNKKPTSSSQSTYNPSLSYNLAIYGTFALSTNIKTGLQFKYIQEKIESDTENLLLTGLVPKFYLQIDL